MYGGDNTNKTTQHNYGVTQMEYDFYTLVLSNGDTYCNSSYDWIIDTHELLLADRSKATNVCKVYGCDYDNNNVLLTTIHASNLN